MSNQVDVLAVGAVLETTDALLHQLKMDPDTKAMHIGRFAEVRGAIIELIEAERDYERARAAAPGNHAYDEDGNRNFLAESRRIEREMEAATKRRADALAKVTGENS